MKKISLKNLDIKGIERLSREQLKTVLGGNVSSAVAEKCNCNTSDDCRDTKAPECAADCDSSAGTHYGHCVAKQTVD